MTVSAGATVTTAGGQADGILAQSIGGGGGRGGYAVSGYLSLADNNATAVSLGGAGGAASGGGAVTVTATGDGSRGLVAQSIGGGAGTGGMAVTGAFTNADSTRDASLGIGSAAGSGSAAAAVSLTSGGMVRTGYLQTETGQLHLDLLGAGEGEYDLFHVVGHAALAGGEIVYDFTGGGYAPRAGDLLTFLTSSEGVFGHENLTPLILGLTKDFDYSLVLGPGGLSLSLLANNDAHLTPIPAALWLFGGAVGLLGLLRFRNRGTG